MALWHFWVHLVLGKMSREIIHSVQVWHFECTLCLTRWAEQICNFLRCKVMNLYWTSVWIVGEQYRDQRTVKKEAEERAKTHTFKDTAEICSDSIHHAGSEAEVPQRRDSRGPSHQRHNCRRHCKAEKSADCTRNARDGQAHLEAWNLRHTTRSHNAKWSTGCPRSRCENTMRMTVNSSLCAVAY